MTPRFRPKFRPNLLELERRDVPALFSVAAPDPAAGTMGDAGAVHTGELVLNPAYVPANGRVTVSAASAIEAVKVALAGTITVDFEGLSVDYAFGPATAGTSFDEHKPFVVQPASLGSEGGSFEMQPASFGSESGSGATEGGSGATGAGGSVNVLLEDLAGRSECDYDYNDHYWYGVSVREVPQTDALLFKLREVTFSGATNFPIEADPGDPTYAQSPQWYDGDTNGMIDAAGDQSIPVGYVRNGRVSVSAKWAIDQYSVPYGSSVQVRADGPGSYDLDWTAAHVENGLLVLPETMLATPLANHVDYIEDFKLKWEARTTAGSTPAGVSTNPLYATFDTPGIAPPIYRTVVHISTKAAVGLADAAMIRDATWFGGFTDLALDMAPPAKLGGQLGGIGGGAALVSRRLHYYKEWDTQVETTPGLLLTRDAQCKGWVNLFLDTLAVQLPNIVKIDNTLQIKANLPKEALMIKEWEVLKTSQPGKFYPHINYTVPQPGPPVVLFKKDANGKWAYSWATDAAGAPKIDVADAPGLQGQGPTTNPYSTFGAHFVALVDGRLYDPSYGLNYADREKWADGSLFGYMEPGLNGTSIRIREAKAVPGVGHNLQEAKSKYAGYK